MKTQKIYAVIFLLILAILFIKSTINLAKHYIGNTEVLYDASGARNWVEADFMCNFASREKFVEVNAFFCGEILHQDEVNEVVKLKNGYLAQTFDKVTQGDIQKNAEKIISIKEKLSTDDIEFLYISTPETISRRNSMLPSGVNDYGNINIDTISELVKEKVNYIDLREEFERRGYDTYDLFYRTDHHWTTKGGFIAYTIIIEKIETLLNFRVNDNIKDLDNYNIEKYENWHMGSRGQRVGKIYAGNADDFDLIIPKFDTSITRLSDGQVGNFQSLIIDRKPLEQRVLSSRYTYDLVLRNTLSSYRNNFSENDKRVVVVCDSMGKAVVPYMILSFDETYTIDAYNPAEYFESVIEQCQPDIVVIMHYPGLLGKEAAFDFEK